MAGTGKRTYLRDVNPHLTCPLCAGYLIDATTVVECLHSFCRSCILKYLRKDASCPSCKHLLNTAKPNIKADKALQDIVYKLVPGLYHKEMRKRREFYSKHPEHGFAASLNHLGGADSATPEQRGEDVSGRLIFAPEDAISLSLEYLPAGADPLALLAIANNDVVESSQTPVGINRDKSKFDVANRRYLQCPALVTIAHLKKFLGLKYSVDMTRYNIDICHRRAPLPEHWTLMDVAYIFAWKRNAPIRFFYRITQEEQQLEAPPNDRPSTPGLGASQPITTDQTAKSNEKDYEAAPEGKATNESSIDKETNLNPVKVQVQKTSETKHSEPEKAREFFARRTSPTAQKENAKTADNSKPLTSASTSPKNEEAMKQVKSPIKIMKNSDGRYQVLRGSSTSPRASISTEERSNTSTASAKSPPASTPAEFSVVSIGDGANSNGVKITLKQCSPSTVNSSKKPRVISNVLLKTPIISVVDQMQDIEKHEKQKRKVSFVPTSSPSVKQNKKSAEQADKKQFLQSFRLTAKQAAAAAEANNQENSKPTAAKTESLSVEAQLKEIIYRDNKALGSEQTSTNEQNSNSPKKLEAKSTSNNIANRIGNAKPSAEESTSETSPVTNSSEQQKSQQPIDVYAFPNDPPPAAPAGGVKRKCPPGLPILEIHNKQAYQPQQLPQQSQQQYQAGKRTGVNAGKRGSLKCYRNQTKPAAYAKPSPSRPLQNLPNSIGNSPNAGNSSPSSSANSTVSSTSPKGATSPLMSSDTRNLLDGCGLNIPASLSITLTAPKSPGKSGISDPTVDPLRIAKDSPHLDKLNPSITLNDKSVDPRVLKALTSGQMRMAMPMANAKTKGRQQPPNEQTSQPSKRRKEDAPAQQARNILDLSASKKVDVHPLRIPTPLGKFKVKPPPIWQQASNTKSPSKDESTNFGNGQVVTLNGGQRFYRAPPGSLTPAAHRIGDIPMPTRAPVYAPSFSSPASNSRSPANLSSVFPSLQSLYALSQAPSLEQFHMDSRLRMAASTAAAAKDNGSSSTNASSTNNKSHIAAQCAPVQPARSSVGSFAVPIAKKSTSGLSIKMQGNQPGAKGSNNAASTEDMETSTSSTDSNVAEQKGKKNENPKEVPSKTESELGENCASFTDEGNSQQGAASPRVTSTASPSPPPNANEASANPSQKSSSSSKSEKRQSSGSEVTSSNKSPESPDSSSPAENVGNLVDSTKSSIEKNRDGSPIKSTESKSDEQQTDAKSNSKADSVEFKKPMTSEALQKRFLAAFPSNEWANNPVAAEQFGNFLKSLSMQAETQKNNAKAVD